MAAGSRPSRIGDQLRAEIAELLGRDIKDPGIGFITITHVKVTPDLQTARVYYTTLGDAKARRETERALERATPYLRRQIGSRLRLKRVPVLEFFYDESIARGDRIEQILHELNTQERAPDAATAAPGDDGTSGTGRERNEDDRHED